MKAKVISQNKELYVMNLFRQICKIKNKEEFPKLKKGNIVECRLSGNFQVEILRISK